MNSEKMVKFSNEIIDVIEEIKKGKADGKIGLRDSYRIGREVKDVVKLLPTIKGMPSELKDMTFEQIEVFVTSVFTEAAALEGASLDKTINKKDVVRALQGIKCFAEIGD